jgi:hypothetical protein
MNATWKSTMTNEHDTPNDNKPVTTDWDAAMIILTHRESLRLVELLESPPLVTTFEKDYGDCSKSVSVKQSFVNTRFRLGL